MCKAPTLGNRQLDQLDRHSYQSQGKRPWTVVLSLLCTLKLQAIKGQLGILILLLI